MQTIKNARRTAAGLLNLAFGGGCAVPAAVIILSVIQLEESIAESLRRTADYLRLTT